MKKLLFFLLVMGGITWGIYRYIEYVTHNALKDASHEMAGGQLQRGRYLVGRAQDKLGEAAAQPVRAAVESFRAQNGRYPSSLQELVDKGFMANIPAGLSYDSSTGAVTVQ